MRTVSIVLLGGICGCGVIQPAFAAETAKYAQEVVWSFGNGVDGRSPVAGVIDLNGTLYGTTAGGGSNDGGGTVFAVDLSSGAEKVLYSFCGQQNCVDGSYPEAGVINVQGTLYGTTFVGGSAGHGIVFSLDPSTGAETVVHSFACESDGADPLAGLVYAKGMLYGTTSGGMCGATGSPGTAFSVDLSRGVVKGLYTFCRQESCVDRGAPEAGVIDNKGRLYGTTVFEGANYSDCDEDSCGVVYSLDAKTGSERVLHSFGAGNDGANPLAGVVEINGTLYGTTSAGGNYNNDVCEQRYDGSTCGVVFAVNATTGQEKVVYAFCTKANCADGAKPAAGLIAMNGMLYGTTFTGGQTHGHKFGLGTVFSLDPKTGAEQVLYSFCSQTNCADGSNPQAGLLAVNGTLYGTTTYGGAYGYGTVFALGQKR